tara:strand:- start:6995 stop:7405 length:411 start_codon:yes stop_codon:yes gene_type:complete
MSKDREIVLTKLDLDITDVPSDSLFASAKSAWIKVAVSHSSIGKAYYLDAQVESTDGEFRSIIGGWGARIKQSSAARFSHSRLEKEAFEHCKPVNINSVVQSTLEKLTNGVTLSEKGKASLKNILLPAPVYEDEAE